MYPIKKLISVIGAIVMLMSVLGAAAYAAEDTSQRVGKADSTVVTQSVYNMKSSVTDTGASANPSTVTSATYSVDKTVSDTAAVGTTYSNGVPVKTVNPSTAAFVITNSSATVGQVVYANVFLINATNMNVENFTLRYETTLFDYLGFEEVPGYKVNSSSVDSNGALRFIVSKQQQTNELTGEKYLLKLKLRVKALATEKVDLLKCPAPTTPNKEKVNAKGCPEEIIVVEAKQDVNRSGEYTLLDLAIDGYYYGQLASNANPAKYNANQAGDAYVTNDDLVYIVNQMLANTKYAPNN